MIQCLNDSMTQSFLIIDDALGVQLLQKCLNIGADLALGREDELRFEFLHNFSEREMAVAEFENDAARSFDTDRALGKEHDRRFGGTAPAASRRKLRNAGVGKLRNAAISTLGNARISKLSHGCPQSEKRPAAASRARHTQNRARRVAPRECHTCRAVPG